MFRKKKPLVNYVHTRDSREVEILEEKRHDYRLGSLHGQSAAQNLSRKQLVWSASNSFQKPFKVKIPYQVKYEKYFLDGFDRAYINYIKDRVDINRSETGNWNFLIRR